MLSPSTRGLSLYLVAVVVSASLCASCSTLQVPVSVPAFKPEEFLRARYDGIVMEVRPLIDRETYWELFDDDLPLAGIAAFWVRIHNSGTDTIDLTDLTWTLKVGANSFADLDSQEALKQFYRGRRIRAYSLRAYRKSHQDLERLTLKRGPLPSSNSREGFVLLRIDPVRAPSWSRDGIIVARGIRIKNRKKVQFELPIGYAHP